MYTLQYKNKHGINEYRKVYSFDDLSQAAKQEAIRDCRECMLEDLSLDDFIVGDAELDTKHNLQKQYDEEFNNILNNDNVVIELIKANEYSYDKDGLRFDYYSLNCQKPTY